MAGATGLLVVASGLTYVVANTAPLVLTARLPAAPEVAASFVSLFVLARIPVFLFGPVQAEYNLSGTLASARPSGATNLLLHTAASEAKDAGCRRLYLGGGTSAKADDPLLNFKRSFGEPGASFHIGGRIHDATAYDALRARYPERAASGRILFYRS